MTYAELDEFCTHLRRYASVFLPKAKEAADAIDAMRAALDKCRGALADIGFADDMDPATRQRKAKRIYRELAEMEDSP